MNDDLTLRVAFRWLNKDAGLFQPPPEPLRMAQAWFAAVFAAHIRATAEYVLEEPSSPEQAQEMEAIIRECKQYTSKSKFIRNSIKTTFVPTLEGWSYLGDLPAQEADARLHQTYPKLKLVFEFMPRSGFGGLWDPNTGTITVTRSLTEVVTNLNLRAIQKHLDSIHNTVRHEVQHFGQDALQLAKALPSRAGLPKNRSRTPGVNPDGYTRDQRSNNPIEHAQRDIEFQTRLSDEVDSFVQYVRSNNLTDWKDDARRWINTRDTFKANKGNHAKWKQLATEFYKAVENRLS